MKIYAFIFVRGGSKGLPGKNIKNLGGLPLFVHAIRLAQSMDQVQGIFVSTDCMRIAAIAKDFGARVIIRPEELASDTASEWKAWQHAITYIDNILKDSFDVFLSLPATSPLRSREDVENCIQALDGKTDIVITVSPSARSPYFNMVCEGEDGYAHILLGGSTFERRQDAPATFDITTVAYVSRPRFILTHSNMFEGRVKAVQVPKERSLDIDDEFDFKIAEALHKL